MRIRLCINMVLCSMLYTLTVRAEKKIRAKLHIEVVRRISANMKQTSTKCEWEMTRLKARVAAGTHIFESQTREMMAWCHGNLLYMLTFLLPHFTQTENGREWERENRYEMWIVKIVGANRKANSNIYINVCMAALKHESEQ